VLEYVAYRVEIRYPRSNDHLGFFRETVLSLDSFAVDVFPGWSPLKIHFSLVVGRVINEQLFYVLLMLQKLHLMVKSSHRLFALRASSAVQRVASDLEGVQSVFCSRLIAVERMHQSLGFHVRSHLDSLEALEVVGILRFSLRRSSIGVGLGGFDLRVRSTKNHVAATQCQRSRQVENAVTDSMVLLFLLNQQSLAGVAASHTFRQVHDDVAQTPLRGACGCLLNDRYSARARIENGSACSGVQFAREVIRPVPVDRMTLHFIAFGRSAELCSLVNADDAKEVASDEWNCCEVIEIQLRVEDVRSS